MNNIADIIREKSQDYLNLPVHVLRFSVLTVVPLPWLGRGFKEAIKAPSSSRLP